MRDAQRRFGQHFLEASWARKLVDLIDAAPSETLLEIGPGRGALTRLLAQRAGRVIAVEIDPRLVALLETERIPNLRLIAADVLDVSITDLLRGEVAPVRVVGNLPYNVSSPILFALMEASGAGRAIRDATLMVQKEVADRIVAEPGTKTYGSLTVQVALRAKATRLLTLPPGAFRPAPKVHSSVIRLRFGPPPVEVGDAGVFERLVRGVFLHRRKTVANALRPVADAAGRSADELLARAEVDGRLRPEMLTLDAFARLSRAML